MRLIVFLVLILSALLPAQNNSETVLGYVTQYKTTQPVANVNIIINKTPIGTTTDSTGRYSLDIPKGDYTITFSCVGYESLTQKLTVPGLIKEIRLNVSLVPKIYLTEEVKIKGNVVSTPITLQEIKEKDLVSMPNLYSDVIRGVKILPGVTSNNELSSAYNVRGGNFDENLIYLNGYEIYRPFLLQQGIEESQSIVNQNMVKNIRFYNGAFPANFDDKMSSVLEINYKNNFDTSLNGNINLSLLNSGLTLNRRFGKLNLSAGFRYADPALFTNVLQTSGKYQPYFVDFQSLSSYNFSDHSSLELFLLKAYNKFNLTPDNWIGNFQLGPYDIKQLTLEYNGSQLYKFNRTIAAIKYFTRLSDRSNIDFSFAYYSNKEEENKNLSYDAYYSNDAYNPQNNMQYLKTSYDIANNSLLVSTYELKSNINYRIDKHNIRGGIKAKLSRMHNLLDESTHDTGTDSVLDAPYSANFNQNINFNSVSGYIEDIILLNEKLQVNFGLRALKYFYNEETLISPRINLNFNLTSANTLNFGWGLYYQPPYFYELRDKDFSKQKPLLSQKAVHYVLSWENKFKENSKFLAEIYYKRLTNLIPYYADQLKLVYADENNSDGYAYGLDLQYEGQLVEGITTWIGYSYLNTKERNLSENTGYQRRLLDQTHTIRIYLQDRAERHRNFQSHVVFIFGSGFLYHPEKTITDTATGANIITPDYSKVLTYPFYFRVDMGLTFDLNLGNDYKLLITPEVYNLFNQYNIASYSWYHVFPETKQPVPVPNIYSKRFFNIGVGLSF